MRTALNLLQEDVSLHRVRIVSDSMSRLQHIQNLPPSQQVASYDENEIPHALVSLTDMGCHLTFIWCTNHSGIRSNELAEVAPKVGTTVVQEEVSHHFESAKAAIRLATNEPTISHERLRRIYGERGGNENHKMENLQMSRQDQFSISRLRSDHHTDLKCWLHKIGRALDTVCRKICMREDTVEHVMGSVLQSTILHPN